MYKQDRLDEQGYGFSTHSPRQKMDCSLSWFLFGVSDHRCGLSPRALCCCHITAGLQSHGHGSASTKQCCYQIFPVVWCKVILSCPLSSLAQKDGWNQAGSFYGTETLSLEGAISCCLQHGNCGWVSQPRSAEQEKGFRVSLRKAGQAEVPAIYIALCLVFGCLCDTLMSWAKKNATGAEAAILC